MNYFTGEQFGNYDCLQENDDSREPMDDKKKDLVIFYFFYSDNSLANLDNSDQVRQINLV